MTPGVFIVCLLKIRQAFEIHHKRYFIGGTKHEKETAGPAAGLTLCLSLAACGGSADDSGAADNGAATEAGSDAAETVTLTVAASPTPTPRF